MDEKERERIESESLFTMENRKPKELVTLGGTAVTEDGKLTRSNYFRFLGHDLDKYDDIKMTHKQAQRLDTHLRKMSTGASAMTPMYCAGAMCPFADRCPLVQMREAEDEKDRGHPQHGKAPIGRQCIIEVQLMKEWIIRYFDEFEIDPNNFTEVAYINELADLMILETRINMNLARPDNAALIIDQTVGVDREGDPIIQKQVSPFLEMKERIATRRSKIIKLMVGDRQEKYKKEAALKMKIDTDPSQLAATMRNKLETLKRELDNVSKELPKLEQGEKRELPEGILTPEDIIASDDE